MRKILTASMVVGAALLVSACGGGDKAANNAADNASNDVMVEDPNMMMEGNAAGGDANAMNDMNSASTADNTVAENAAQ